VKLIVESVLTYIDVSSCENVEVTAKDAVPLINADRVKKLEVFLNEKSRGCKVTSINSKDIGMTANRLEKNDFAKKYEDNENVRLLVTDIFQMSFSPTEDKLLYEAQEGGE